MTQWHRSVASTGAVAILVFLTGCGTDGADDATVPPREQRSSVPATRAAASSDAAHDPAVDRGAEYVATQLSTVEPHSLVVFDYLARKWQLGSLRHARGEARRRAPRSSADDPLIRLIFPRRVAKKRALAGSVGTDRLLAIALRCDRSGYPGRYGDELRAAIDAGGMDLTHVAFALEFARELRCPAPVPRAVRTLVIERLRDALAAAPPIDDLSLEQAAMLCFLGDRALVPPDFVTRAVAAQQPDGGWAAQAGNESSWHTTGLAVWVVSAARSAGADVAMVGTT